MAGSPTKRGGGLAQVLTSRLTLVAITLMLAFLSLVATHFWQLYLAFQDNFAVKVQLAAMRAGDALQRKDAAAADVILQSLRISPEISAAALYTADGKRLAEYRRDADTPPPELTSPEGGSRAVHIQHLRVGRHTLGNLVVRADFETMLQGQYGLLGVGLLSMLLALGVGGHVFIKLRHKVEEVESDLRRMAWYDPVTQLPNRNLFMQRLREAIAVARRESQTLAVLFIDLDNFKLVNDTLGHEAGDVLLVTVAARLRGLMREEDEVCRLGGDEFVILLHPSDREQARRVGERTLEAIRQPVSIYSQDVYVGGSIGIAQYPDDGHDDTALLRCADTAMYQAKDRGRNNVQFYTSDMNLKALQQFAIETSLRKALSRNEMLLYYQPLVDVETRRIVGVEALLRWKSQEFGTFASSDFIAIAEQSGLIGQIGQWALDTACRQMGEWRRQGITGLSVAVNLSARQFHNTELVKQVKRALADSGLEPSALELEVTESVLIKHNMAAIEKLGELADLGVKLAIDDFGTGYSSLSYLKQLPIHRLKIDKSFISESHIDPDDAAIASAIIGMAAGLGIEVTAEGVENEEQLLFLKKAGCQIVQGYFFGSPLPADEFAKLVRQMRG